MDKRIEKIKKINSHSRGYEFNFGEGVYGRIAYSKELKKIYGIIYQPLLVMGDQENLILIKRDFNKRKEIIKIHSEKPDVIQSQLEKITGMNFSQYRVD